MAVDDPVGISESDIERALAFGHHVLAVSRDRSQIDTAIERLNTALEGSRTIGRLDLWVRGANDLAGLLKWNPRGDRVENLEKAISLLRGIVEVDRMVDNRVDLGLALTNLATCVLDLPEAHEYTDDAMRYLEEALPLRGTDDDRAYTSFAIGLAHEKSRAVTAADRKRRLAAAGTNYAIAIKLWRRRPRGREDRIAQALYSSAIVVHKTAQLERSASLANRFTVPTEEFVDLELLPLADFNLRVETARLALINPAALGLPAWEGPIDEISVTALPPRMIASIGKALKHLDSAQKQWRRVGYTRMWCLAESLRAEFLALLDGPLSAGYGASLRRTLDGCQPSDSPQEYARWAQSYLAFAGETGDWSEAVRAGLLAVEAHEFSFSDQRSDSTRIRALTSSPVLARRLAYFLVKLDRAEEAVQVLEAGRQRMVRGEERPLATAEIVDLARELRCGVVYIVPGVWSVVFILVDAADSARTIKTLEYSEMSSPRMFNLVGGFDPQGPGLSWSQIQDDVTVQGSLDRVDQELGPMMTALNEWLIEQRIDRLVLVPTGPYNLLPFHIVHVGRAHAVGNIPFGWIRPTTNAPSAAALARCLRPRRPMERSIGFIADPRRSDLPPLPGTIEECTVAQKIMSGQGWRTRMKSGSRATIDALRKSCAGAGILHFSGHAGGDPIDESNIVLCLADRDLHFSELPSVLGAAPQLLVLSACQSGHLSTFRMPDETLGLATAAMSAGVRCVVGSVWPVQDDAAAALMKRFYVELTAGGSARYDAPFAATDALRRAQIWLAGAADQEIDAVGRIRRSADGVCEPRFSSSQHWGAFVSIGI